MKSWKSTRKWCSSKTKHLRTYWKFGQSANNSVCLGRWQKMVAVLERWFTLRKNTHRVCLGIELRLKFRSSTWRTTWSSEIGCRLCLTWRITGNCTKTRIENCTHWTSFGETSTVWRAFYTPEELSRNWVSIKVEQEGRVLWWKQFCYLQTYLCVVSVNFAKNLLMNR